jgi:transposase
MTTKREFQLTEQQNLELKQAFQESNDGRTRTRIQAVRLYGSGFSVKDIQEITGCSTRSLLRWCERYRKLGIKGLIDQRKGGNRARLSETQIQDVSDKLQRYRPIDVLGADRVATMSGLHWTVLDLKQALQQWHGVVYRTDTSYRALLRRCGFSYQRSAKVFRSRSIAQVAAFEEQLEKN